MSIYKNLTKEQCYTMLDDILKSDFYLYKNVITSSSYSMDFSSIGRKNDDIYTYTKQCMDTYEKSKDLDQKKAASRVLSGIMFCFRNVPLDIFVNIFEWCLVQMHNENGTYREQIRNALNKLDFSDDVEIKTYIRKRFLKVFNDMNNGKQKVFSEFDSVEKMQPSPEKTFWLSWYDFSHSIYSEEEIDSLVEENFVPRRYDGSDDDDDYDDLFSSNKHDGFTSYTDIMSEMPITKELLEKRREIVKLEFNTIALYYNLPIRADDLIKRIYESVDAKESSLIMRDILNFDLENDVEKVLRLTTNMWNIFPHKVLGGKCPLEMW
jgi:hypothetical protein